VKIAFIDANPAQTYDAETPLHVPMSGSEAAMCHLASAVAARGHAVSLLTGREDARMARGVRCSGLASAMSELASYDVLVVLSSQVALDAIRAAAGREVPLVVWEQSMVTPATTERFYRSGRARFDAVAFVSNWQREQRLADFGVERERTAVLGNAIGPRFERLFAPGESVLARKVRPFELIFTSSPPKGLRFLVKVFPRLRRLRPDAMIAVYSSLSAGPANSVFRDADWQEVYDACRNTPGMNYSAWIEPARLVDALVRALALYYPNTEAETSSICTMEAMAAGCVIVVPALGALPETLAGYGSRVAIRKPPEEGRFNVMGSLNIGEFAEAGARVLRVAETRGDELDAHLRRQVDYVNARYVWSQRAVEWEEALARWFGSSAPGAAPPDRKPAISSTA